MMGGSVRPPVCTPVASREFPVRFSCCELYGIFRSPRSFQEDEISMRLRTLAALLALVLLALPAAAQEQRGSIEGVVKDTSGAVLPGVTVDLSGGAGVSLNSISDAQGVYRFPSLLPGIYS